MPDSPFDTDTMRKAKALLAEPTQHQGLIGVMAAAAFFAVTALALVVLVISLPSPWPA